MKDLGNYGNIRFNSNVVKFAFLWILLQGKKGGWAPCDISIKGQHHVILYVGSSTSEDWLFCKSLV